MPKLVWTEEDKGFVIDNIDKMTVATLAKKLGKTRESVKSFVFRNKLGVGYKNLSWGNVEDNQLRQLYPRMTNAEIAKVMGKTEGAIVARAWNLRLKKDKDWLLEVSSKSWFKPGKISWNKGKKIGWIVTDKMRACQFKKGNRPHNAYDGDGLIVERSDGLLYYKLADGDWVPLHRKVWEDEYGPVPDGMMVILVDGNKKNCVLENLRLISRAENAIRNSGSMALTDSFVLATMRLSDENRVVVEQMPELIELKRNLLKTKRIIRDERKRDHDKRH